MKVSWQLILTILAAFVAAVLGQHGQEHPAGLESSHYRVGREAEHPVGLQYQGQVPLDDGEGRVRLPTPSPLR